MAIVTNLDLLRRVPLFSLLTVHQAEALGSAVSKRRFKRGEALVVQGQKSDALYLLLTGRARVSASDTRGREVILATLMPGDYLGEMSIIDNEPHSASVHALVQTDVLALGRAEFTRCLAENVSMSLVVMRGEKVLVAAHGNSLRALIMVLERLSPDGIVKRELATGVPLIYRLNADSTVANMQELAA